MDLFPWSALCLCLNWFSRTRFETEKYMISPSHSTCTLIVIGKRASRFRAFKPEYLCAVVQGLSYKELISISTMYRRERRLQTCDWLEDLWLIWNDQCQSISVRWNLMCFSPKKIHLSVFFSFHLQDIQLAMSMCQDDEVTDTLSEYSLLHAPLFWLGFYYYQFCKTVSIIKKKTGKWAGNACVNIYYSLC